MLSKWWFLVVDEAMKFLANSCWQFVVAASIILPKPVSVYTGESACFWINFIGSLGGIQHFAGGAPIALMRLLFIVYPNNLSIGQKTVTVILAAVNTTKTLTLTYLWAISPRRSMDLSSLCLGTSQDFHTVHFDYSSDHSLAYERTIVAFALVAYAGILVLSEMGMYGSIYSFLTQHDREMTLALSENAIRSRNKKNAIDLTCHVVACIVQLLFLILAVLAMSLASKLMIYLSLTFRVLTRCYSMSLYGLLSALHIALSPPLRRDFKEILNSIFGTVNLILRQVIRLPGQIQRPRVENQVHVPTIQAMNDQEYHHRQRQTESSSTNSQTRGSIKNPKPMADQEQAVKRQSPESDECRSAGFGEKVKMDEPHNLPGSIDYDDSN